MIHHSVLGVDKRREERIYEKLGNIMPELGLMHLAKKDQKIGP